MPKLISKCSKKYINGGDEPLFFIINFNTKFHISYDYYFLVQSYNGSST